VWRDDRRDSRVYRRGLLAVGVPNRSVCHSDRPDLEGRASWGNRDSALLPSWVAAAQMLRWEESLGSVGACTTLRLQGGDNFVGWVTGNALVRTLAGVGKLGRGHTNPSAATGVANWMAI
jgi:hypothetical protein